MFVSLALLLVSQLSGPTTIPLHPRVVVTTREVTLGQLADLDGLSPELRAKANDALILRLKQQETLLTSGQVEERDRAAIPALAAVRFRGSVRIEFRAAPATVKSTSAPLKQCVVLRVDLDAGAVLRAKDVSETDCAGAVERALRYDTGTRTLRTKRALAAGSVLPYPDAGPLPSVQAGDRLTLRSEIGPVTVERDVTALQAGEPDRAIWVRGQGGRPFRAIVPGERTR